MGQIDQTNRQLLRALAQELKLPLLQIARQAELAADGQPSVLQSIETSANQALWYVDSYLLSQQLLGQGNLELEPVTVAAALDEAAHSLQALAKQYDCELELQLSGRYGPVMAHRQGLQAALVGLGATLITASQPVDGHQAKGKTRLTLAGHKSRGGVVAGVFSQSDGLSQSVYRRGKALYGRAAQALPEFSAQPAAGVFMADLLFDSMNSQLRVAHHHKLTGLAATLQPSRQLALI